jgi:hypothetical protein
VRRWAYAYLSARAVAKLNSDVWSTTWTSELSEGSLLVARWSVTYDGDAPHQAVGSEGPRQAPDPQNSPPYNVESASLLNLLGDLGWEAFAQTVGRTALLPGSTVGDYTTTTSEPVLYTWALKRELE